MKDRFTSLFEEDLRVIVRVFPERSALGLAAAERGAAILKDALAKRGRARIVVATGSSQFEFLDALVATPGIACADVELFHLDEYVGLPRGHRASFRRYIDEPILKRTAISKAHLLDGEGDLTLVLANAAKAIAEATIDAAFVGIGENGHLAFNGPPADFQQEAPYVVAELDEICRRQQVGEG